MKTIQLNDLSIKGKIFLAPVAGFSDSPFRKIAIKHGAAMVVTELISSEGIIRENKKTIDLLKFDETERPIGIQIFGNKPEVMAEAAHVVEKINPDCIDINFGCPAPKVVKMGEGAGAALLLNPDKLLSIVQAVVNAVSLPVTAKIRLGWNNETKNYKEVVTALEEGGIKLIAVHGRTASQKYNGLADWNAIEEIAHFAKVPIVGNGDIKTYDEALSRLKSSGCTAVMVGRGAFGNPWIFSGKNPTKAEIISQMKEHLQFMMDYYGPWGLILMRKHYVKYIHDYRNSSLIRGKLVRAESEDEISIILNEFLEID